MPDIPSIRAARLTDIERLQDIERLAGVMFIDVGMPDIASHEPFETAVLSRYLADERLWVWVEPHPAGAETVAGYIMVELVDGVAHVAQVSVDPAWAHHGIGRRLIDHVAAWAASRGMAAVTLTTFRDVPWNGPYYERIGFRVLSPAEIGPGMHLVMRREATEGLDPSTRVAMTRPVHLDTGGT